MSGPGLSRRGFIALSSAAGLMLCIAPAEAGAPPAFAQRFLRIDPDGTVTVIAKHLDMGQGIWSGLAAIVAEELDADWSMMRVEGAPARLPDYAHTLFKSQTTGGSTSTSNSWDELRHAGATARAMLVAAAALRWGVAADEIVSERGRLRHGAREAGYGDLAADAARLPVPTDVPLKDPARFTLLGRERPRLDIPDKTRGRTRYGIDVRLPGMKHAVLLRPPRFGARLVGHDLRAARATPGILAVVPTPVGIAVIGETGWHAMRGRAAIVAAWDDSLAERRSTDTILAAYRALAGGDGGFTPILRGDPITAFTRAAAIVEAEFSFPYLAHAPMEPLALAGQMIDGRCELHGGFQSQTANQAAVARVLGIAPDKVSLETLPAGGSFGRRASFTSDWVVELAEILKATGGRWPLQLLWTRADDLAGGYYRPLNHHRIRVGVDAAGDMIAIDQAIVGQSILFGQPTGHGVTRADPTGFGGNLAELYDCADGRLRWIAPEAEVPVHTYRSISNNHTAVSKEILIDRLARRAGADPIDYRLRHLKGQPRQAAILRMAAEKAGPLPAGRTRGVAVHLSEGTAVAQIAELSGTPADFRIERVVCAVDCGIALDPDSIRAQVEGGIGFGLSGALHGEIRLEDGRVVQDNFDSYPILRIDGMPRAIETHILPGGARPSGIGEPGSVPIAAAVANALERMGRPPIDRFPLLGSAT